MIALVVSAAASVGGEDRHGVGERIGADDEFERVEGAGQRRAERRRDRARPRRSRPACAGPAGAGAGRARASRRRPRRSAHSRPRARPTRRSRSTSPSGPRRAGCRVSDIRPPRSALASTGSTAGGSFRRARQKSIEPSASPASIGAAKAAIGGHTLGGAQTHVEGNAVDQHMRGVDDRASSP